MTINEWSDLPDLLVTYTNPDTFIKRLTSHLKLSNANVLQTQLFTL